MIQKIVKVSWPVFYKGINYEVLPGRKVSKNDVANERRLSLPHAL